MFSFELCILALAVLMLLTFALVQCSNCQKAPTITSTVDGGTVDGFKDPGLPSNIPQVKISKTQVVTKSVVTSTHKSLAQVNDQVKVKVVEAPQLKAPGKLKISSNGNKGHPDQAGQAMTGVVVDPQVPIPPAKDVSSSSATSEQTQSPKSADVKSTKSPQSDGSQFGGKSRSSALKPYKTQSFEGGTSCIPDFTLPIQCKSQQSKHK